MEDDKLQQSVENPIPDNGQRTTAALGQEKPLLKPLPQGKAPVISPAGEVGLVDENMLDAYRKSGYRVATQDEVRHQQVREIYGDAAGSIAGAALGGLDTVSMGTGKGILYKGAEMFGGSQAAQNLAQKISDVESVNQGPVLLGKGLGFILPAALTGGSSLLEEGAGEAGLLATVAKLAPSELAYQGARAVGEGIAEKVGGGVLGTAAQWGAQGALESSLYGLGANWSEATIANEPITIEKLTAGAGKNALLGGSIGAGLGLLGGLAAKGASAIKVGSGTDLAEKLAVDSLHMTARERRILEESGIDANRLGNFMLKHPEIEEVMAKGGTSEQMAEAFETVRRQYGTKIGEGLDHIENVALTSEEGWGKGVVKQPDMGAIIKRVYKEVIEPLEESPFHAGIAKRMNDYVEEFGLKSGYFKRDANGQVVRDVVTGKPIPGAGNISFRKLHEFRQKLDDIAYREGKVLSTDAVVKELQQYRKIMEEEFRTQAPGAEKYLHAAEQYRYAAQGADIAAGASLRRNANLTLPDVLTGAMGYAYAGPKGLLLGLAAKAIRERGQQFVAAQMHRAMHMGKLRGTVGGVTQTLKDTAKAIVRSAPKGTVAVTLDRSKQATKAIKQVKDLAASPERVSKLLEHQIDASLTPNIQMAYVAHNVKALQYLAAVAPVGVPLMPALAGGPRTKPSKLELSKWMKKLDVYVDPVGAIRGAMRKNQLSTEHIEALGNMYPMLYHEMQGEVMMAIAERMHQGTLPGYRQRLQLGLLTGAPTDATLDPIFISSQQDIVDAPPEEDTFDNQGGGQTMPRNKGSRPQNTGGEETLDKEMSQ